MSLRDGSKKMSKSDPSDYSRINLTDSADLIAQKIRRAKTDPDPLPSEIEGLSGRLEAENLVSMYAALRGVSKQDVLSEFGGSNFSQFKNSLVEVAEAVLAPIASEMRRMQSDQTYIDGILRSGAERARILAGANMSAIKDIVGFIR